MLIVLSASCFAQSQNRNCGTMEYLEMQKKADSALQQRMEADEIKTQEWIKNHTIAKPVYPAIEGFKPTGNDAIDKVNYAKAKEAYLAMHPDLRATSVTTENSNTEARERKKHMNSFTTK